MIPKELQNRLDEFTTQWKKHCDEELAKFQAKFSGFDSLVSKLDTDFLDKSLTILDRDDWLILRNWISDLDALIFKMQLENGTKCLACQNWIEEKLKGG